MIETQYKTLEVKVILCCSCGVPFAMTSDMERRRREDNKPFYCPNGHPQSYSENEMAKLKKENERLQREKQWEVEQKKLAWEAHERARRSASAIKGALTRTRKRVGHGVCPKCTRTFQNLQRHMACKHPKYGKKK